MMKRRRLFRLPLAAVCLLSICLSACGDDSISSGSSVISSLTQTTSSVSLSTTSPTTAPTLYVDPETGIRYENRDLQGKKAIHILYYPEINVYNGTENVQAVIKNYC